MNQAATPPIAISADEGKSITLPCITDTSGGHQVRWYAPSDNQQPVLQTLPLKGPWYDSNQGTIHANASLEIYSVSIDDSGLYVCETFDDLLNEVLMTIEVELLVHGKFCCC